MGVINNSAQEDINFRDDLIIHVFMHTANLAKSDLVQKQRLQLQIMRMKKRILLAPIQNLDFLLRLALWYYSVLQVNSTWIGKSKAKIKPVVCQVL